MKRFIAAVLLLFIGTQIYAETIDQQAARQVAQRFISSRRANGSSAQLTDLSKQLNTNGLYVFAIDGGGFIVVSDDERVMPVLAYSFEGRIDAEHIAPATRFWLNEYSAQIAIAKRTDTKPSPETSEAWSRLREGAAAPTRKTIADSVPALITSQWKQSGGYNILCPTDSTLTNTGYHTTTGCVATAMAQIMRYWQFPTHGMGSQSYSHDGDYDCWRYGTQSANFGATTYDWANMPVRLTDSSSEAEINAVATLCYHCGVSTYMMYNSDCNGSSGSYSAYANEAFTAHFHYKTDGYLQHGYYNDATWKNIMKNTLSSGHPVMYGGQSIEDTAAGIHGGGHAFIMDGYNAEDYFHFNWGWGGYYDGYYLLSALNPSGNYLFSNSQDAIIGIEPEYGMISMPQMAQPIALDGEDFQMGGTVSGTYAVTNVGDTVYDGYIGVNIYNPTTYNFYGWLDASEVHIQPGDTVYREFNNPGLLRPIGRYYALAQYNATPLYVTDSVDNALNCFSNSETYFNSVDSNRSEMHNITVAVKFQDDEDLSDPASYYNTLLNSTTDNIFSALNYIKATTDGQTNFLSLIPQGNSGTMLCYADSNARGIYMPYSAENQMGYVCENQRNSRLMHLMGNIMNWIDSIRPINQNTIIDCDGDGYVDNLTLIMKYPSIGDETPILGATIDKPATGELDTTFAINKRRIGHYAIVLEGSDASMHSYSLLRALGLPNLSHETYFTNSHPMGYWDMMDIPRFQQPSTMLKYKYLGIGNPTEIDTGTYTIATNMSNHDNCYYLPINGDEQLVIEYRHDSSFDEGVAQGLIVYRWNNKGDNRQFDNDSIRHMCWLMRPGSTADTTDGYLDDAFIAPEGTYTCFAVTDTTAIPLTCSSPLPDSLRIEIISFDGDSATFRVSNNQPPTEGISNTEQSNLSIYPNPTNGQFVINGAKIDHIEIYNTNGAFIDRQNGNKVDISNYPNGIYFARIYTNNNFIVQKIVKF